MKHRFLYRLTFDRISTAIFSDFNLKHFDDLFVNVYSLILLVGDVSVPAFQSELISLMFGILEM